MQTFIFGHRNPDTDSVCASMALSYLMNETGKNTVAKVLGHLNNESKFVIDYFKVKEPVIPFGTKYEELEEHDLYTSYHVILENITNTNYNIDKEVRKFG